MLGISFLLKGLSLRQRPSNVLEGDNRETISALADTAKGFDFPSVSEKPSEKKK